MHETSNRLLSDGRSAARASAAAPHFTVIVRICALVLALLVSGEALAAGFTCTQPVANANESSKSSGLDELEEVVVKGEKSTESISDLDEWLGRLSGQYTYEGYVDLCGNGNASDQRPVKGKADCIIFNSARSTQCLIDVRWPEAIGEDGTLVRGGVSTLSPAVVVYGLEPHRKGIQFMQVDSTGIAEPATGKLFGSTLISREPCVGTPGNCMKITRITARPDSYDIVAMIDIEINRQRVMRYALLMQRVPQQRNGGWRRGASP